MAEMFLPPEVTAQILVRLPVRYILQFRSVCKTWRDMIDDQVFAASHLDREIASGKKGPTSFFLRSAQHEDVLEIYLVEQQEEDVHMFNATKIALSLPETVTNERVMWAIPARGLFTVCFYGPYGTQGKNIFYDYICNPFTGQFFSLPLILSQEFNEGIISAGFGYDPSTREFKLLRIFFSWTTREVEVLLYTLGSKSWKKLENIPIGMTANSHSVSIDNMVHWFPLDDGFLATFDFASETFGSIQLPESRTSTKPGYLYNLDGYLSFSDSTWNNDIEVWVMKDYGVTESWTRFVISKGSFEHGDYVRGLQPVSFLNNIEILLLCNAETLEVHNTQSGTRTPVHIRGLPGYPRISAYSYRGDISDLPEGPRFSAYSYCGNLLSLRPAV